MVGGAPVDLLSGAGKVILADNHQSAVILLMLSKKCLPIFSSRFIEESRGSDIRCLVVGDKVVAAMKRQAKEGEFRANVHQGGKALKVKLTPDERALAIAAAKILGLRVAGVDLIRSDRGPLVLEINSSPGLEGVERASQVNVAGKIIQYIEKHARPITLTQRFHG